MNEEDENDGKGHGGSSDFDDEDDIGMGRGGGGDDWEDDKPRQPTPAYVNRLYKPRMQNNKKNGMHMQQFEKKSFHVIHV